MNIKLISKNLKTKALEEGFAIAGIASIPGSSRIKLRTKALNRWLENNFHGEMKWMEAERRKDINSILNGAQSVLAVGYNYLSKTTVKSNRFKIAKFGQGDDYHKVIKKKLNNIGKWINSEVPNCQWKICVDSSPLLEKAWAEESGLGWIGKNSNLINKNNGSWLSLGFMIFNIKFEPDQPAKSLCGQCEKCIDKCPTKAITEPFVINSQLCIAYHTIENRSKNLPINIKKNLNGWIAGCDICQDICPWNKSAPLNNSFDAEAKSWMRDLDIDSLNWNDEEWSEKLKGTTLKRIKPWMWKRNIKASIQKI
tara:strand:+ start:1695 stop:2624 length:930 start_codon:yes stop_codon:yes gene_type:complete